MWQALKFNMSVRVRIENEITAASTWQQGWF